MDFKPENIVVCDKTAVKVSDFQIAKVLYRSYTDKPNVFEHIGSKPYAAPELICNQPKWPTEAE